MFGLKVLGALALAAAVIVANPRPQVAGAAGSSISIQGATATCNDFEATRTNTVTAMYPIVNFTNVSGTIRVHSESWLTADGKTFKALGSTPYATFKANGSGSAWFGKPGTSFNVAWGGYVARAVTVRWFVELFDPNGKAVDLNGAAAGTTYVLAPGLYDGIYHPAQGYPVRLPSDANGCIVL